MGKLIYSMITSLDGYVSGPDGSFGWGVVNGELHDLANEISASVGTYLYGRKMYETMVFWETAHSIPDAPPFVLEYARVWQGADKIVYSSTLENVASQRTRIERAFDPEAVRSLKAESERDITIDGPTIAAQAIEAGLVDEYELIIAPAIVGGGKRFFPDEASVTLKLLDERRLSNGVIYLRYGTRDHA